MIGAYLKPWATFALLNMPAVELTDQNVSLEDVWGSRTAQLAAQIAELDEAARVDRLEAALLEQLRRKAISSGRVDIVGLAQWAQSKPISVTVSRLADAAGISRRHLNRVFREVVGVSPKRYCRLARFQTALKYAGGGSIVKWAEVAAELGYADQSHLIAEFRELSGLTPEMFNAHRWFHPFMATQSRLGIPTGRPKD
jgi:AraC-like DNA-binding protein